MTKTTAALSAALVLGLAACSSDAWRVQSEIAPAYDYQNFASYHAKRDTRVEIMGSTFGAEPSRFARAVTEGMRGKHHGAETNFTTTPGASAEKNLKVVLAFNTEVVHHALCSGKPLAARTGGGTTLQAAWCFGDRVDSYVIVRGGAITGIDDPKFKTLLAEATLELFPPYQDEFTIMDNGGIRDN